MMLFGDVCGCGVDCVAILFCAVNSVVLRLFGMHMSTCFGGFAFGGWCSALCGLVLRFWGAAIWVVLVLVWVCVVDLVLGLLLLLCFVWVGGVAYLFLVGLWDYVVWVLRVGGFGGCLSCGVDYAD